MFFPEKCHLKKELYVKQRWPFVVEGCSVDIVLMLIPIKLGFIWCTIIIELKEQRNELMHCTCINNVHTITGYCLLLMRIFQSKCNEDNAVLIKS